PPELTLTLRNRARIGHEYGGHRNLSADLEDGGLTRQDSESRACQRARDALLLEQREQDFECQPRRTDLEVVRQRPVYDLQRIADLGLIGREQLLQIARQHHAPRELRQGPLGV